MLLTWHPRPIGCGGAGPVHEILCAALRGGIALPPQTFRSSSAQEMERLVKTETQQLVSSGLHMDGGVVEHSRLPVPM